MIISVRLKFPRTLKPNNYNNNIFLLFPGGYDIQQKKRTSSTISQNRFQSVLKKESKFDRQISQIFSEMWRYGLSEGRQKSPFLHRGHQIQGKKGFPLHTLHLSLEPLEFFQIASILLIIVLFFLDKYIFFTRNISKQLNWILFQFFLSGSFPLHGRGKFSSIYPKNLMSTLWQKVTRFFYKNQ